MKKLATAWLAVLAAGTLWVEAQESFLSVSNVMGLVFVPSLEEFQAANPPYAKAVEVRNLDFLQSASFTKVAGKYLGRPLDLQTMRDLQENVILYCRDRGFPVVDVIYPVQTITNGVLKIIVLPGKLAKIEVQPLDMLGNPRTNTYTQKEDLLDRISLKQPNVIDMALLRRDLDWLNRNSMFRQVGVFYQQGQNPGETDLTLKVKDRFPLRPYLGYDNTGSRVTDINRIYAGFDWGRAFGLFDHQFNYQFTADPELRYLRAHSAVYTVPLPWRHGLRVFGYYLDAKADLGNGVTVEGPSYQTSFRYDIPLPYVGKYQHEFSAGLDFKSTENNLAFNEATAANTPTEIFQVAFSYVGALRDKWGDTTFSAQLFYSPGDVTSKNTDFYFQQSRAYATADYVYARLWAERRTRLPWNFSWVLRGTVQFASGNLLPTEQLGFGGYNTIRGYDDREVNADEGWIISNELRTPLLRSIFARREGWEWMEDTLEFLVFYDMGQAYNKELLPLESSDWDLSSVGFGVRYKVRQNLDVRFDYGWQLSDPDSGNPRNSRGHVGVQLSY